MGYADLSPGGEGLGQKGRQKGHSVAAQFLDYLTVQLGVERKSINVHSDKPLVLKKRQFGGGGGHTHLTINMMEKVGRTPKDRQ